MHGSNCEPCKCRQKQRENQEDLLTRVNEETRRMLQRKKGDGDDGTGPGRKVTETCAYRSVADMPAPRDLAIQVRLACLPVILLHLHCCHQRFEIGPGSYPGLSSRRTADGCVIAHKSCQSCHSCVAAIPTAHLATIFNLLILASACPSFINCLKTLTGAPKPCLSALIICVMLVQVDQRTESVLLPIYGIMVPFHILTIKNATNNQDNDHAYIRINFNFGTGYEPSAKFPNAIFLKELSFRSSDTKRAAKVKPLIQGLCSSLIIFKCLWTYSRCCDHLQTLDRCLACHSACIPASIRLVSAFPTLGWP